MLKENEMKATLSIPRIGVMVLIACCNFVLWVEASVEAQELITVAASYGPGGSPINGVSMSYDISTPVINDWGEVSFRSEEFFLNLGGYHADTVWLVSPRGEIRRVAQEGGMAPGADPLAFEYLGYPSTNALNQSVFTAILSDDTDYGRNGTQGFWAKDSIGNLRLVALIGQQAPGTQFEFDRFFTTSDGGHSFAISQSGTVSLLAQVMDPLGTEYSRSGIWVEDDSHELKLAAMEFAPVAGFDDGTTFRKIYNGSLEITDSGVLSFLASHSGPNISDPANLAVWRQNSDSTYKILIGEGDMLPSTGLPRYLHEMERVSTNNRGDLVFVGTSRQSPERVLVEPQFGSWLVESDGRISALAIEDAPVPGMESTYFGPWPSSLGKRALINGIGDVAFVTALYGAEITDDNDSALWLRRADGTLRLIAQEGDVAPNGAKFASFFSPFNSTIALNNLGQIAFQQGDYLWAADQNSQLKLIAEVGQQVDVKEGPLEDIRTIEKIYLRVGSGGEDGARSGFNDLGQIVFLADTGTFSAAVFLSNALMIPEPTSLFLVLSGVAGILMIRGLAFHRVQ